jgi:hypothetical protein
VTTESRTDFVDSWLDVLEEQPQRTAPIDTFSILNSTLNEFISLNPNLVVNIGNNVKKLQGAQVVYYWIEVNNKPAVIVEAHITAQNLKISALGKDPAFKKKSPHASDLYIAMLNDSSLSLRITSDTMLSDEGYSVWRKLFHQGYSVSIYNNRSPGQSFKRFNSETEMLDYLKHDRSGQQYQYVLSEDRRHWETFSFFSTRRMRELAGTL